MQYIKASLPNAIAYFHWDILDQVKNDKTKIIQSIFVSENLNFSTML